MALANAEPVDCHVYVGTHAEGEDEGIRIFHFSAADGSLEGRGLVPFSDFPGFQVVHPGGRFLYSANRKSGTSGRVVALAIDPDSGQLEQLNEQSSQGEGPCHVNITSDGSYVLVANYGGSTAAVLPVQDGGTLGEASSVVKHEGSSVHQRQNAPHPHGIYPSPDDRFVLVPDLGIDQVVVYSLEGGQLEPTPTVGAELEPGSGPRHFAFHPDGQYGYVINELSSTMAVFSWFAEMGELTEVQTINTLPGAFEGSNSTAEIFVHPSGRWVYGSNRGHDSICVFKVEHGQLERVGHVSTGGNHPRYFGLDPSGTYLFAANMNSDNIVTFLIDEETGLAEPTGAVTKVPAPTCITMVPV